MSKIHFYSHLIELDSVFVELDKLELSDEQRAHLAQLIDANLHHSILDGILSELTEEDKKLFMEYLLDNNHDTVWKFLNQRIDKIEDKIKKTAEELKKELHKDIDETKGEN